MAKQRHQRHRILYIQPGEKITLAETVFERFSGSRGVVKKPFPVLAIFFGGLPFNEEFPSGVVLYCPAKFTIDTESRILRNNSIVADTTTSRVAVQSYFQRGERLETARAPRAYKRRI